MLTSEPGERTGEVLSLSIPPDIAAVSTARLFAAAVARGAGLAEDALDDLRLAVSEGVTNAVKSHQAAGVEQPIEIRMSEAGRTMVVEIIDAGAGLDENGAPHPSATDEDGRLGLVVIRALYPDASFTQNPGKGMTLRLQASGTRPD